MQPTELRKAFPSLARIDAGRADRPLAYLDNAATTQTLGTVLDAVHHTGIDVCANPYRGVYQESREVTKLYEASRSEVARFIGAAPGEVVFVRNATEALNIVATSWAEHALQPGDEIALPISEHHSNLVIWQRVCCRTGAKLVYLRLDEHGRLTDDELDRAIGPRTRVVAIAHTSNVLGTVFPLEKVTQAAHAVGAVVVADCAQASAHHALNLRELDVDFAAISGHKMYGPAGIGVLYAKTALLAHMEPFLLGGEMVDEVWDRASTYQSGPRRFEAGTPNVAGAFGLAVACAWLENVSFPAIEARERALTERLLAGMGDISGLRVFGNPAPADDRAGVVAFTLEGVDPIDAAYAFDKQNVAVRAGSHCAQPLHRRLGVESTCRASVALYTTEREIDRFLEAAEHVRERTCRTVMAHLP